jgi:hypothetical protein
MVGYAWINACALIGTRGHANPPYEIARPQFNAKTNM